ncbi:MAG TPA: FtsK/SpoIIIE domain-containing protein, partial [Acidimicrobiales bacterium]|nr:FtsK/SpoIIIE domain-containing protein [Acidimicrobiales bacterium]
MSLWQRRAGDPELLALHLGTGAPRWPPPLAEARDVAPEAAELAVAVTLPATPVGADLVGDGALGLVGDRAAALAVARSLVCQAATHAGPSDLRIAVVAAEDRRRAWAFTGWLPHRRGPVATDAAAVAGAVASLPAGDDASSTLLVVDGESVLALPSVRRALEQPRPALILAAAQTQLPASCRVVVEVGAAGDAELRRVLEGSPPEAFLAAGTGVDAAARWARDLARFGDPRLDEPGRGEAPHAAAFLGSDAFDPAALAARWSCPGPLAAPVGVDDDGVVAVELGPGRPHVAVAGPPGPARGDAVRTLVAGLAAAAPPGRLSVVLVDAGGAGDLDVLAALPHCRLLARGGDALRALRAAEADARGGGPGGDLVVVLDGGRPEHAALVRRLAASPAGPLLVVAAEEGGDALAALGRATEVRVGAGRGELHPPGGAEARPVRLATLSRPDGGRAAPVVVGPFGDGTAAPAEGYDVAALVAAARQAAAGGAFTPAPPLELGGAVEAAGDGGLASLLGLGDLEDYDPAPVWAGPRSRGGLAVPIGAGPDGRPLVLDLKEAALGGMGPHGLVAGATGSGKSEA